jgi:WD40 repeat protein
MTCSEDAKAVLWDPLKQTKTLTLEGHSKSVTGAALLKKRIVTISDDTTIRTWNHADGKPISVVNAGKHVKSITALGTSCVACSVMDGSVIIVEVKQE